jgi:hypothetical protein
LHSAFVVHLPHSPGVAPDSKQNGSAIVPQGSAALEPKSPSQDTHFESGTLHTGVSLGHRAEVVHWTHV